MSSSYTFKWPAGPQEVIVTGTFDSWKKTLPLVKQSDGSFEITVPLKKEDTFYKYVVDGEWLTNNDQKKQLDSNGIENNYLSSDEIHETSNGSKIPEAGGLAAGAGAGGVSTTVMPKTEGQQQTLGEPGIFVPQDKDQLAAFEKVEDVDSRKQLTPAEKKQQKKKLKRIQHKARKKQKAAAGKMNSAGAAAVSATPSSESVSKETGDADKTVHESLVPIPGAFGTPKEPSAETSSEKFPTETSEPVQEKSAPVETSEPTEKSEPVKSTEESDSETESKPTDGHPVVSVLATTEIIETVIPVQPEDETETSRETAVEAPVSESPVQAETPADLDSKSLSDNTSINPSIVAVHQANVVPTVVGSPDAERDVKLEPESKEREVNVPAPVAADQSVDERKEVQAEPEEHTLDPTVVGVIAAGAGGQQIADEQQSADSVAKRISSENQPERAIQPAISAPIEPESKKAGKADKSQNTPESVLAAPIKPLNAKEVNASPVHGQVEEEIIITQGGNDVEAIEEQIIAAESGPVSVEQIQPTESQARELAEEAHIPESQLGLDKKSKKTGASKDKKEKKEKKKTGFVAKIKKIFK